MTVADDHAANKEDNRPEAMEVGMENEGNEEESNGS